MEQNRALHLHSLGHVVLRNERHVQHRQAQLEQREFEHRMPPEQQQPNLCFNAVGLPTLSSGSLTTADSGKESDA